MTARYGVFFERGRVLDEIISQYSFVPFGELNYCWNHGIMYQRDMSVSIDYGESYFSHYINCENTEIAKKLNRGRHDLAARYCSSVLDIGIGSGEFIKESSLDTKGFDINPLGVEWLKSRGIYSDPYVDGIVTDGITFWDSLEHIPEPNKLLDLVPAGKFVFISMPIFTDLVWLRSSKHYKPNEHYYYFTLEGMTGWMKDSGFDFVEVSDHETRAGREGILSFVFLKS